MGEEVQVNDYVKKTNKQVQKKEDIKKADTKAVKSGEEKVK